MCNVITSMLCFRSVSSNFSDAFEVVAPFQLNPGAWSTCSASCGAGESTKSLTCTPRVAALVDIASEAAQRNVSSRGLCSALLTACQCDHATTLGNCDMLHVYVYVHVFAYAYVHVCLCMCMCMPVCMCVWQLRCARCYNAACTDIVFLD